MLGISLPKILEIFSIDFGGPFPKSHLGNNFLFNALEHLKVWHIAAFTSNASMEVVIEFVERETVSLFEPPKAIISDIAGCFTATSLVDFHEKERSRVEHGAYIRLYVERLRRMNCSHLRDRN